MKAILVAIGFLLALATAASAQGYGYGSNPRSGNVGGYYRSDGGYVDSYQRTMPNRTDYDNYSTRGNYNPNTGQTGNRIPRRY